MFFSLKIIQVADIEASTCSRENDYKLLFLGTDWVFHTGRGSAMFVVTFNLVVRVELP